MRALTPTTSGRRAVRRVLAVPVAAGIAALLAAGCGQASDTVTSSERLSVEATTPSTSSTTSAPTTVPRLTVAAPETTTPTSGSADSTAPPAETLPTVVPSTSRPSTPSTAAPPTTAGDGTAVAVNGVQCARHPEDGGDWVVFYLSSTAVNASARGGPSPIAVAGDGAVVLELSPAALATGSRYDFTAACDHVGEVAVVIGNGTLTWAIGTRGAVRLLNGPTPSPTPSGAAVVVKVGP